VFEGELGDRQGCEDTLLPEVEHRAESKGILCAVPVGLFGEFVEQ
jgi:hypothetical protein